MHKDNLIQVRRAIQECNSLLLKFPDDSSEELKELMKQKRKLEMLVNRLSKPAIKEDRLRDIALVDDKKAKYMGSATINYYKEELEKCNSVINSAGTSIYSTVRSVDVDAYRRKKRKIEKILSKITAPNPIGDEKNRKYERLKELEKELKVGMPTVTQMKKPTQGNIDKFLKWREKNKGKDIEWKNIARQINPDDPSFANIERLRLKK